MFWLYELTSGMMYEVDRLLLKLSDFPNLFSRIRTKYGEIISVFSTNAGKYGAEKLRIRTLLTQ